ncbi:MAG: metabolite traffic protein EboE [Candidatus Eremiobacterota bacterium]
MAYCTNIHAGNGWTEVFANLRRHAPELKRRLSPERPFALGLRLSAREAAEVRVDELSNFLRDHDLYVPLLNGFPHGNFHGSPVKEDVFRPDWRDPARLDYTLRLAGLLARLLPPGMEGGVSTLPLTYRPWVTPDDDLYRLLADRLREAARGLERIEGETGRRVHLDVEPEPDGLLSTARDAADFFRSWLEPGPYLRVCLDACHSAVEFESPELALEALQGIPIGRVQVSAALKATFPGNRGTQAAVRGSATRSPRPGSLSDQLEQLAEPVYLHQVVEDTGKRYPDLCRAQPPHHPAEWRIHFHVPLFVEGFGELRSTRDETRALLTAVRDRTAYLEIETYTWAVLPEALRSDLTGSIEREYRWVLEALAEPPSVCEGAPPSDRP